MLTDVGVLAGVLDNACVLDNVGVLVCWRAVLAIVRVMIFWRARVLYPVELFNNIVGFNNT